MGGTNIAVGLVDENGKIVYQDSTPTLASRPGEEIVKDMCTLCEKVVKESGHTMDEVASIGVGCPGTVDNKNGVIAYANNIRMENFPMRKLIQSHIDKPVNLENDANAAAYGEYIANGNGVDDYIFITLGTGVGGGMIINKKIYRGFNCAGAELGHITLMVDGEQCSCGRKGCWEAYASATALIRQTKKAMEEYPDSLMHKLAKEEGKVSGRTAFDAMRLGDIAGIKVVDDYIKYVACGLINIVNALQPEIICIGGGICNEGETLMKPLRRFVQSERYSIHSKIQTKIVKAELGNDAGVIGAALLGKVK